MEFYGFALAIILVGAGGFHEETIDGFSDASQCFDRAEVFMNEHNAEYADAGLPYTCSFELIGHTEIGDYVLFNSFPSF